MFIKGSRYLPAEPFAASGDRPHDFQGVRSRSIGTATGVVEHILKEGERLDLLARHYYNDDRQWWRIADANREIVDPAGLMREEGVGRVILIPRGKE